MASFTKNFQRFNPTSSDLLSAIDSTKRLADGTKTSAASLSAQRENSKQLLATSVEMIVQLGHIQDQIGMKLVTNLPLPTQEIRDSHAQSLGYAQLGLRFLGSGMIHFMSQYAEACEENEKLKSHIIEMAKYEEEVDILGVLQEVSDTDLSTSRPLSPPASPTSSSEIPPVSDTQKPVEKKSEAKVNTKKDRRTPSK